MLITAATQQLPGFLHSLEPALNSYGYLAIAAFVLLEDFGVPVPGETVLIAGAVYGPLIQRFAREARGHGVPEVMLAVAENGGRIRPPVTIVKALASALCIGGAGSVGREGPIVQIGSVWPPPSGSGCA